MVGTVLTGRIIKTYSYWTIKSKLKRLTYRLNMNPKLTKALPLIIAPVGDYAVGCQEMQRR